jgi:hypothetical protein
MGLSQLISSDANLQRSLIWVCYTSFEVTDDDNLLWEIVEGHFPFLVVLDYGVMSLFSSSKWTAAGMLLVRLHHVHWWCSLTCGF